MEATAVVLTIPAGVDPARICGPADAHLRVIERTCAGEVSIRGDRIALAGTPGEVELLVAVFQHLIAMAAGGEEVAVEDIERLAANLQEQGAQQADFRDTALLAHRGRTIRAKTCGQRRYIEAIERSTITFCLGPAGTGKTYLAMAAAVAALKRRDVSRIVLTRPVVEAGENLGFLPGTLEEKVDPYVRPLHDALLDMMEAERVSELIERGVIEIAPLAYMRGRTLNDAFVILDEAQNTTPAQMKMFLTRLGFNARFVITGDATQRDLAGADGLSQAERVLAGVEDIAFVRLERSDVVRHRLVGRIVDAYERAEAAADACRPIEKGGRHGRSHQQ